LNVQVNHPAYDPYDLWSTASGIKVRRLFYQGRLSGKAGAIGIGLIDWLLPIFARALLKCNPGNYPVTIALQIQRRLLTGDMDPNSVNEALELLRNTSVDPTGKTGWAWGLGFPWMSKNGLYSAVVPFITHTPYVMEALLGLAREDRTGIPAKQLFLASWDFLLSLRTMYQSEDQLALSYAPLEEPRMVVNANAYAAFAYAMHFSYGIEELKPKSLIRVKKLLVWISAQQQKNGSWLYYADDQAGNFIDCFHSCFVVKNLIKVRTLLAGEPLKIDSTIEKGWRFIQSNFFDHHSGLCRRFTQRDIKDPFRWDLYDQAEYLGLLIDFDLLKEAQEFTLRVEKRFKKGTNWYCRIDIFGRRWGKNFLRWGIAPFEYQHARLQSRMSGAN